jgi:hypothetical protein
MERYLSAFRASNRKEQLLVEIDLNASTRNRRTHKLQASNNLSLKAYRGEDADCKYRNGNEYEKPNADRTLDT